LIVKESNRERKIGNTNQRRKKTLAKDLILNFRYTKFFIVELNFWKESREIDITPIESRLKSIKLTTELLLNWKNVPSNIRKVGVGTQDAEEVEEDAVRILGNNGKVRKMMAKKAIKNLCTISLFLIE